MSNSVIWPVSSESLPILSAKRSVNQMFPSAPTAMPYGPLAGVGTGNSTIAPFGEILPILVPTDSVNHRFPSGPGTIV
jgi:hypothetical protein